MSQRSAVYKVVKKIEETFDDVIAYAYFDVNVSKTYTWWNVCISNYELYYSKEFKEFSKAMHNKYEPKGVKLLFCYCNPIEKKLFELAEQENLIINLYYSFLAYLSVF